MSLTLVTAVALAIVGALLGSIVSGRSQERAAERSVRVSHGEAIRRDRLEAVTTLACAVSNHRRAMWMGGVAVLKQGGSERIEALRSESHMTGPPSPARWSRCGCSSRARRCARRPTRWSPCAYAQRDAYATSEQLTAAREAATVAHNTFVDTVADYLSRTA